MKSRRRRTDISITLRCPNRACLARIRAPLQAEGRFETHCPACHAKAVLTVGPDLLAAATVTRCPACGGQEFFIRKDFPQKLGMAVVVLGALTASAFYYVENVVATFSTLAGIVLLDAVIYLLVGRVTVCYRCRAELRRLAYNPRHKGFDLAASEKYE